MVKEDTGDKVKSLVLLLVAVTSVTATHDPPFGTTANGGFDINSISSFLDDIDGSSTKIEFPLHTGKGGSFSYNYPSSGPSSYGYKVQPPQYNSPVLPTAPPPVYSLKPSALPTEPPLPSTVSTYSYQTPTKGYVQEDQSPKETVQGQGQLIEAADASGSHGSYRPPNKNYVLGDPSLKNANVQTSHLSSASNPLFPNSHGSYRPPNKNYVLGDPNNKSSSQTTSSFFPQQSSNYGSSQISNFAVSSPQTNPPSGFGSHTTLSIGSSTPSYDKKVVFGSQSTGLGNQQGSYSSSTSNGFPGQSFTSPGSFNNQGVNPFGQTSGHVNSFKTPSFSPTGLGTTGFGQTPNQHYAQTPNQHYAQTPNQYFGQTPNQHYGQKPNQHYGQIPNQHFGQAPNQQYAQTPNQHFGQVNFGGHAAKFVPQLNTGTHQYGGHSTKYGNPGIGGFSTNYLIPSNNYVNQPGKYGIAPSRYPINQGGFGHPAPAYNPTPGVNYPSGVAAGYGHYPGGFKGNYNLKGEAGYTKGAYNPGRYRRVPGQYPAPYRGQNAQGSNQKGTPYMTSPFSIFEDMMLL